ncbi:MAG: tetratricopeptide repeat protein [Bacteroidia bacterium]|nr:tetratricopeptide repeat protein [Bacteroidia bacterium]
MEKSCLSFWLYLLLLAPVAAQVNLDSLKVVWQDETQPDSNRLKAGFTLAWEGYLFSQPDSAYYFSQLQLELAREKGLKKYESAALNTLGIYYAMRGDYPQALDHFSQSLKIKEEIGDTIGIAAALNNIGRIYDDQGDYTQALDHYSRSLKMEEALGNKGGISASLNAIGTIYMNQGDYTQALNHYTRSLTISEEIGDKRGIANSLGNIGKIYKNQGDYAQALEYYIRNLKITETLGDKVGLALTLINIGTIYTNQGDYVQGLEHYSRGLKIYEELGDKGGIANGLAHIASIYEKQGNYAEALNYLSRSLKIKEEIGNKEQIASSLHNIGIIYKDLGNYTQAISYGERGLRMAREVGKLQTLAFAAGHLYYSYKAAGRSKQALEMYELYIQMHDSLNSEENQRATIRFEYQQQALADSLTNAQEKALAQVAYENQLGRQRLQLGFAAGVGGLLALLAVVLFVNGRRRRKTNELLRLQKGEIELKSNQNELLLKEIHHRVKNNLQTISSLLYLQSAHIKDADVKQAVVAGQHRVESMALIHQKLYQRENLAAIEMKDYLTNLGQSLLSTFGYPPERIGLHIAMEELELDVDSAVPLGLIVNELITNSLKYAFPDGRSGTITVSLKQVGEGLELFVGDDGVGAANTASGTSFGSQLVRLLTTQLGGQLEQGVGDGYWTRILLKENETSVKNYTKFHVN